MIAPPGSENKRLSRLHAVIENLTGSKDRKRCVSRDMHASSCNVLVANFILMSKSIILVANLHIYAGISAHAY